MNPEPAVLVPELEVASLDASLAFYVDRCGFAVRDGRAEDGFAVADPDGYRLRFATETGA